MNAAPDEAPQWRHYNFFTVGVFTSEVRAKACVAERGHAAVSMCPITLNAPLFPCLSSAVLSAHQTRLLVSHRFSATCSVEPQELPDIRDPFNFFSSCFGLPASIGRHIWQHAR